MEVLKQVLRLLQPPVGQQFAESLSGHPADHAAEIIHIHMQNLRQIAQGRILVVGAFDEVAALIQIIGIVALFASPGDRFAVAFELQPHISRQKIGVGTDLAAALAGELPGTATVPARRELMPRRQQIAEVDHRGEFAVEKHRLRVIPDPLRAESPERAAAQGDLAAARLVRGACVDAAGLLLGPAAEITVVMVLVGGKLKLRHLRKRRMKDFEIDHRAELQLQLPDRFLQIHRRSPFL